VKIDANRITPDGVFLEEEFKSGSLDIDTETVEVREPIKVRAELSRITNAVTVKMNIRGKLVLTCSRCIKEFIVSINKDITLNYPVSKLEHIIDLDPEIREELILHFPFKPLCNDDCKGLCKKCGENLNEGGCSCGPT
jgi:uncharacterized protein